jgi:hypothetical protein
MRTGGGSRQHRLTEGALILAGALWRPTPTRPLRTVLMSGVWGPSSAFVVALALLASYACGGTQADAASCAGSKPIPQRYVAAGTLSTHIRFVQTGCSIGIASIEVYAGNHLLRKKTFSPALPAGTLNAGDSGHWSGTGKFHGTAQMGDPSGTGSSTQDGTFKANARVVLAEAFGGPSKQWATAATASSQLSDNWSATKATGPPARKAWAPSVKDGGAEWLELTYAESVVPIGINVWENNGPGFVTKVEAFDQQRKAWVKLWEGTDPTSVAPRLFSPPLAKTTISVSRIRLTVNTKVPDWNEIAAVALVGAVKPSGKVFWMQGEWAESGKDTVCVAKTCTTLKMSDPTAGQWSYAFNTLTGKLGSTPDQVR